MEEFNFASERVQELISRLEGVTFFCSVATMAVTSAAAADAAGTANPISNSDRPSEPDFNSKPR